MHAKRSWRHGAAALVVLNMVLAVAIVAVRSSQGGPAVGLDRAPSAAGQPGQILGTGDGASTTTTGLASGATATGARVSPKAGAHSTASAHASTVSAPGDLRNPADLARWRAAVADRASHPADVVVVGDSITEGYFVTDQDRWISQLRRDLQGALDPAGTPGGEGFIPAWHLSRPTSGSIPEWSQRWSVQGFPSTWDDSGYGLARRALVFTSTSESAAINITGDRFWLAYTEGPNGGLLRVNVDGGAPAIVDTRASTARSGRIWDSGSLARGPHTVSVTALGGSQTVLDGIMAFDGDGGGAPDQGKGIRVWDGGHSRYTSTEFGGEPTANWADGLDNIRPDLVVIELGANDQFFGHPPDVMAANLTHIVQLVRDHARASGAPLPSIALMPVWAAGNQSEPAWENYRNAILNVADTQGCAVLDIWNEVHQAPAKPGPDSLFLDVIHPSVAGHRWLGDLTARLLQS